MKGKVVFAAVTFLATVAVALYSPYGYNAAVDTVASTEEARARDQQYEEMLQEAKDSLLNTVEEFNNSRTFDVYYGDVDRLVALFEGLPNISVEHVVALDPLDNFAVLGQYNQNTDAAAVRVDLLAADYMGVFDIVQQMQLPVVSVSASYPNSVSIVFLTGGAV